MPPSPVLSSDCGLTHTSHQNVTEADVELYWHQLDADNSGQVDKGEFYDLCDIMQYCLERAPVSGLISNPSPAFSEWVRGTASFGSWNLDTIINYVLAFNSILVRGRAKGGGVRREGRAKG